MLVDPATYSALSRETRKQLTLLEKALDLKGQKVPVRPYCYTSVEAPQSAVGDDSDMTAQSVVLRQDVRLGLSRQLDSTFHGMRVNSVDFAYGSSCGSSSSSSNVHTTKSLVSRRCKGDISVRVMSAKRLPHIASHSAHLPHTPHTAHTAHGVHTPIRVHSSKNNLTNLTDSKTRPSSPNSQKAGKMLQPHSEPSSTTRFSVRAENSSPRISHRIKREEGSPNGDADVNNASVANFTVIVGEFSDVLGWCFCVCAIVSECAYTCI